MLVSRLVDAPRMFGDVRAVVVDEVHAFAGDDRGWHLLAVLERLDRPRWPARPADRALGHRRQPGRAADLAAGPRRGRAACGPSSPRPAEAASAPELALDYVGSVDNAATVISTAAPRGEAAGLLRTPVAASRSSRSSCASGRSRPSSRTPRCRWTSAAEPRPRSPRPATASSSPPPPSSSASTSATSTGSSSSTRR